MFTVMFLGMLRGFKHIKHIYRNTDIGGNATGSLGKHTDTLLKTYTLLCRSHKTIPKHKHPSLDFPTSHFSFSFFFLFA